MKQFILKLKESLVSVLPVTLIVILLNFTPLVNFSLKEIMVFIFSAFLLILGIGLFNLGADMAMTPMGKYVGAGLTKSRKVFILILACFLMGLLITVAESDKAVIISCIREDNIKKACEVLEEKFDKIKGGKGVAFTIPLKSIIGVSIYQFLSNNRTIKGGEK